jgi:YggT family protein
MGYAIGWLINAVISLMIWFIIAQAILSWLVAFDVVNYRNRFVYSVGTFLDQITRPLLEPFRRMIPSLGGIDISPIVVILLLQFVSVLFARTAWPALINMLGG